MVVGDFMLRRKLVNQQGLTLIELMMVASIMAILIAIILPNVFVMVKRAQNADITNNGKKFHQFLEQYAIESESATASARQYPANASEMMDNATMKSLFLDSNIENPFYASPGNPIAKGSNLLSNFVRYQSSGAGNRIVIIPESKAEYNVWRNSASHLSTAAAGSIVYFPFDVNSEYTDTSADPNVMVDGFELRGVDSEGRVIKWYTVSGGNPYAG